MEERAVRLAVDAAAVARVAAERAARSGQMRADLVRAPGFRPALDDRAFSCRFHDVVRRLCGRAGDGRAEHASSLLQIAGPVDDREVPKKCAGFDRISTSRPRRRRDASPRSIRVAAAAALLPGLIYAPAART